MSQGLTWIAGRRTPLLALVALFALTVGMFSRVVAGHTRQRATDDVPRQMCNSNSGVCMVVTMEQPMTTHALFFESDDDNEPHLERRR